jgi:hypothetical protein
MHWLKSPPGRRLPTPAPVCRREHRAPPPCGRGAAGSTCGTGPTARMLHKLKAALCGVGADASACPMGGCPLPLLAAHAVTPVHAWATTHGARERQGGFRPCEFILARSAAPAARMWGVGHPHLGERDRTGQYDPLPPRRRPSPCGGANAESGHPSTQRDPLHIPVLLVSCGRTQRQGQQHVSSGARPVP